MSEGVAVPQQYKEVFFSGCKHARGKSLEEIPHTFLRNPLKNHESPKKSTEIPRIPKIQWKSKNNPINPKIIPKVPKIHKRSQKSQRNPEKNPNFTPRIQKTIQKSLTISNYVSLGKFQKSQKSD